MKNLIAKHLLVAIALLVLSMSVFAYFAGVAGKYKGSVSLEGLGTLPVTAELKGTDDKLTGLISSSQGDAEIVTGSVKDGKFTMAINVGDMGATVNGTVDDKGKFAGSISGDQINGTIELTRADDTKPTPTPN